MELVIINCWHKIILAAAICKSVAERKRERESNRCFTGRAVFRWRNDDSMKRRYWWRSIERREREIVNLDYVGLFILSVYLFCSSDIKTAIFVFYGDNIWHIPFPGKNDDRFSHICHNNLFRYLISNSAVKAHSGALIKGCLGRPWIPLVLDCKYCWTVIGVGLLMVSDCYSCPTPRGTHAHARTSSLGCVACLVSESLFQWQSR